MKCDETRPACRPCQERKWPCQYPGAKADGKQGPLKVTAPDDGKQGSPRTAVLDVGRQAAANPNRVAYPTPSPSAQNDEDEYDFSTRQKVHEYVIAFLEKDDQGNPSTHLQSSCIKDRYSVVLEIVDHFLDTEEYWVGSPLSQTFIRQHGMQLTTHASYMMHTIISSAATHLSFLHPHEKKYSTAAMLHYTRALRAYSAQLVYDLERGNALAMLATTGIVAKLSFIYTPQQTADTPLAADTSPSWIRSMQGVKTIMSTPQLRTQLQHSPLAPMLLNYETLPAVPEAVTEVHTATSDPPTEEARLLRSLGDFCWVPDPTTALLYARVLARLKPLMLCTPSHEWVDKFMAFIATLEPSFIELLEAKEARALLIFSFWCARIARIPQFWTAPSARIECSRVCAHLQFHQDERVRELLKFPARFCGFELRPRGEYVVIGMG